MRMIKRPREADSFESHEIIGKAIKVGPKVKSVKVGDRVGVGAQIWACLECKVCKSSPTGKAEIGNENYW